jgi:hypothetical protein
MTDIAAILLTGVLLASAQACMTVYARGLPRRLRAALKHSVSSLSFYGFVLLYALATIPAIYLFGRLPLAQVSVSVMAVTFLAVMVYALLLGQRLALRQILGGALLFTGFYLLQ